MNKKTQKSILFMVLCLGFATQAWAGPKKNQEKKESNEVQINTMPNAEVQPNSESQIAIAPNFNSALAPVSSDVLLRFRDLRLRMQDIAQFFTIRQYYCIFRFLNRNYHDYFSGYSPFRILNSLHFSKALSFGQTEETVERERRGYGNKLPNRIFVTGEEIIQTIMDRCANASSHRLQSLSLVGIDTILRFPREFRQHKIPISLSLVGIDTILRLPREFHQHKISIFVEIPNLEEAKGFYNARSQANQEILNQVVINKITESEIVTINQQDFENYPFIKKMKLENVEKFDFRGIRNANGMQYLCDILKNVKQLKRLSLPSTIDQEAAKVLANYLTHSNIEIKALYLSPCDMSAEALTPIARALSGKNIKNLMLDNAFNHQHRDTLLNEENINNILQSTPQKSLQLKGCTMNDEVVDKIVTQLRESNLTFMDFSNNHLDDQKVEKIVSIIGPNIKTLILKENNITDRGAASILNKLKDSNIEALDLSGNQFTSHNFVMNLKNTSITNLNLRSTRLGDDGLKALAQNLPKNIGVLLLGDNNIGPEGFTALCDALSKSTNTVNVIIKGRNNLSNDTLEEARVRIGNRVSFR